MPAEVPGAIDIGIEQADVLAMLVDGVVGEVVGLRAAAAGEAVGGPRAVVVAAVVNLVIEAAGTHEQTEVLLPVEVHLGQEAGPVGDQAALVEGVVAVVDVGDGRVRETVGQRVIAGLGSPREAIGEGSVPVELEVFVGLERQCLALSGAAGRQAEHGNADRSLQGTAGGSSCCSCHVVALGTAGHSSVRQAQG
ncbi:hypothetical protein D3C84_757050 [compost metagenome]